jgi:uncharacterized NAD-dependent epimerase/dehydratase family protein
MDGTAIILTQGLLTQHAAKTAHGLIRGTRRYHIVAVVDHLYAGKDAGTVLDGKPRGIPVVATVEEALAISPAPLNFCVIGIAPKGGKLPQEMKADIRSCILHGISIVSGLHDFISDMPDFQQLAAEHHIIITDIRKPRSRENLHFWTGKIFDVHAHTLAVLGTDTCLGKRTTARMLTDACQSAGIQTEMISTGQTGWMQDGRYGFVLDTIANDFVSGEMEHAICTCDEQAHPDLIVVEGQSSLRNPTGPCGAEFLMSGNIKEVILQHAPKRVYYGENPGWGRIPSVQSEIALIAMYGASVLAITLNTEGCTPGEAQEIASSMERELQVPVLLPLEDGVGRLVKILGGRIGKKMPAAFPRAVKA